MNVDKVVESLDSKGYYLAENYLCGTRLEEAEAAIREIFPDPNEAGVTDDQIKKARHATPFPFHDNTLNGIPFDQDILDVARKLFKSRDARLTSCFVQAKYGKRYGPSHDQALHNDAWDVTNMLFPLPEGPYQRLFGILYLTDVEEGTGPTKVVARARDLDVPLLSEQGKASYSREAFPSLYQKERSIIGPKGSLLLFLGDIVHRGSAFENDDGARMALFFNFHSAQTSWTGKHLWALRPDMPQWTTFADLITHLSPSQRELIGFPPVGDPYWNPTTVNGLRVLYPSIDTEPYQGGES